MALEKNSEDYENFEKAFCDLQDITRRHPQNGSEIHCKLAEAAEELINIIDMCNRLPGWPQRADLKDIAALNYLALHRKASDQIIKPDLKNRVNPLVDIIHNYFTTHHNDVLVHAQQLAQAIGNPKRLNR